MAYISSANVNVFPSALRTYTPSGKFINETNFTNILESITDTKDTKCSYIVSYEDNILILVIHGYLFEINNFSLSADLNAYIKVETTSNCLVNINDGSPVLDKENTGIFEGLLIDTTSPSSTSGTVIYSLKLTDSESKLKTLSKTRFNSEHIRCAGFDTEGDHNLNELLSSKENVLTVGTGLSKTSGVGLGNTSVSLVTTKEGSPFIVKSLIDNGEGRGGTSNKPVYFDTAGDNYPRPISTTSGQVSTSVTESGITYWKATSAVVTSGEIIPGGGQTTYISQSSPASSMGNVGDIWFKYGG